MISGITQLKVIFDGGFFEIGQGFKFGQVVKSLVVQIHSGALDKATPLPKRQTKLLLASKLRHR